MKICSRCKAELSEQFFYKNKSKKGGLSSECKECSKNNDKLYRRKLTGKDKLTVTFKQSVRARTRRHYKGQDFNCAVLSCNKAAEELHHIDYNSFKEVIPLCKKHHFDAHNVD